MNKKIISFAFGLAFFLSIYSQAQVPISSLFNSQNYWLPSRHFGGSLETYWNDVAASGVKYMRVGGIAYDAPNNAVGTYTWTVSDLCTATTGIIDEFRSHGIQPILQVPVDITKTVAQNATNAAALVTAVNVTNSKNITYWEIGNEPNGQYAGTNNYNTDAVIADYIRQVSSAMKAVSGQSGIKIIGPSFSYYTSTSYLEFLGVTGLPCTTCNISGKDVNNHDYIDYIDFHIYPFQNECYWQHGNANCTGSSPPGRTDVIGNLTAPYQFKANLQEIISNIPTLGRTNPLKISITEANISYEQNRSAKGILDLGPGSFLGGQYWAEMMCIAMEKGVEFLSFWSVITGTSGDNYLGDIGYIGSEASQKRPAYWHYQMVANNFTGTYFSNASTASGQTNYKAFACSTATELRVIIMNQNVQSPRGSDNSTNSFKIDFNYTGTNPTGADMLFAFACGNTTTYSGGLQSGIYSCSIQKETSMFLAFNKTTGQLLRNEVYSLQDALRANDVVGPNSWGGTTGTINSQALYTGYNSANVYTNIVIGVSTGITAVTNNVFQFTNTATVTGPFSSGTTGKTLSIVPTSEVTCH